jgi:hypothetical protein
LRLDIDDVKIQEEEVLAFLSESKFSNINYPMYTALFFKERMRVQGLREKGLSSPHYSMHHIKGFDLLCFRDEKYIPQSLRQRVLQANARIVQFHKVVKTMLRSIDLEIENLEEDNHLGTSSNPLPGYKTHLSQAILC